MTLWMILRAWEHDTSRDARTIAPISRWVIPHARVAMPSAEGGAASATRMQAVTASGRVLRTRPILCRNAKPAGRCAIHGPSQLLRRRTRSPRPLLVGATSAPNMPDRVPTPVDDSERCTSARTQYRRTLDTAHVAAAVAAVRGEGYRTPSGGQGYPRGPVDPRPNHTCVGRAERPRLSADVRVGPRWPQARGDPNGGALAAAVARHRRAVSRRGAPQDARRGPRARRPADRRRGWLAGDLGPADAIRSLAPPGQGGHVDSPSRAWPVRRPRALDLRRRLVRIPRQRTRGRPEGLLPQQRDLAGVLRARSAVRARRASRLARTIRAGDLNPAPAGNRNRRPRRRPRAFRADSPRITRGGLHPSVRIRTIRGPTECLGEGRR